jgi:hypothetical protein
LSNNPDLISIKELASKLKVSDALLKKIIKDFDIQTERLDKRVCLTAQSMQLIRDILALRASGKKNQEIKEMFDATQSASQSQPTTEPALEVKETSNKEPVNKEPINKEPNNNKESNNKEQQQRKNKRTNNRQQAQEEQPLQTNLEQQSALPDISGFLDSTEEEGSAQIFKEADHDEDTTSTALEDIEEELESEEDEEEVFDRRSSSSGKVRRRSFSFRYIQRQIMNDTKRVNYIKSKLKRGSLSTQETLLLKDSLEHRSKLLSGWVHMLRWVKS